MEWLIDTLLGKARPEDYSRVQTAKIRKALAQIEADNRRCLNDQEQLKTSMKTFIVKRCGDDADKLKNNPELVGMGIKLKHLQKMAEVYASSISRLYRSLATISTAKTVQVLNDALSDATHLITVLHTETAGKIDDTIVRTEIAEDSVATMAEGIKDEADKDEAAELIDDLVYEYSLQKQLLECASLAPTHTPSGISGHTAVTS